MPKRLSYDPQPKWPPTPRRPATVHLRRPPADALIAEHKHSWGQIVCPQVGTIRVRAAATAWIVPTFRAVWIPPRVVHEISVLGRVEFFAIYVHPSAAPAASSACAVLEVSALVKALMTSLADCSLRDKRIARRTELMLAEFEQVPRLPMGLPFPSDKRLLALCEALTQSPDDNRTLRQWAPLVGASERTLARLFQDELKTSFGAWRRQARLAHAAVLLAKGIPVTEVASSLGYSTPSAFTTMFKQALGTAPTKFFQRNENRSAPR